MPSFKMFIKPKSDNLLQSIDFFKLDNSDKVDSVVSKKSEGVQIVLFK